jgi:hypothetical protein
MPETVVQSMSKVVLAGALLQLLRVKVVQRISDRPRRAEARPRELSIKVGLHRLKASKGQPLPLVAQQALQIRQRKLRLVPQGQNCVTVVVLPKAHAAVRRSAQRGQAVPMKLANVRAIHINAVAPVYQTSRQKAAGRLARFVRLRTAVRQVATERPVEPLARRGKRPVRELV